MNLCDDDILTMSHVTKTLLEGQDKDWKILGLMKDDSILTRGGPKPIKDYASFVPGAIVPPDYMSPQAKD